MSALEALILGILQGLTEFLPVSSSGHIELGKAILGVELEDDLRFSLIVHFATVLSTFIVFRKDIWNIIQGLLKFEWNAEARFASLILLSMLPVTIVGLGFEEQLEALFGGSIVLVGCMLLVTGGLLLSTIVKRPEDTEISFRNAFLVGIAQAVAVLPGISRSGATISTGLLLGIPRDEIARFSFLMVMPPIIGKTLLDLKDLVGGEAGGSAEFLPLLAGFAAAFITGLIACKWMIALVQQERIRYFAFYCFAIGLIAIAWSLF